MIRIEKVFISEFELRHNSAKLHGEMRVAAGSNEVYSTLTLSSPVSIENLKAFRDAASELLAAIAESPLVQQEPRNVAG